VRSISISVYSFYSWQTATEP